MLYIYNYKNILILSLLVSAEIEMSKRTSLEKISPNLLVKSDEYNVTISSFFPIV